MRFLCVSAVYILLTSLFWSSSQALVYGFDPAILKSVVAVVPKWPENENLRAGIRNAPEGTAVAVLSGGYLVTNSHVLGRAKKVDIRLKDGRLMAVSIVGRDPRTDLALLRAPKDFPILPNARATTLGEKVCAVGNQFGLGLSVTCGVISALNRTNARFNPIEDFVQTDATINPGGSGGALVNSQGQLIGIVSAIFTKNSDANIGVNFAASIDLVVRVIEDLKTFGRVKMGFSGFSVVPLRHEERRTLSGVRISRVVDGGAGKSAGLRVGDIITHIGSRAIVYPSDMRATIFLRRPGDTISIKFVRQGAKTKTKLTLKSGR